jgi:hypothetical protein
MKLASGGLRWEIAWSIVIFPFVGVVAGANQSRLRQIENPRSLLKEISRLHPAGCPEVWAECKEYAKN